MVRTFHIEAKYYARARQAHGMTKYMPGHPSIGEHTHVFSASDAQQNLPKLFAGLADKLPPIDPTGINGLTGLADW
eukprot:scaffold124900_cov25-Prasinocladus_malaysianus.AAC.1